MVQKTGVQYQKVHIFRDNLWQGHYFMWFMTKKTYLISNRYTSSKYMA